MLESFIELARGDLKAEVATLGAKLSKLAFGSIETIAPAPTGDNHMYYGVVVAPWPNRCAKGEWVDPEGIKRSFPINEADKNNALHGLVYDKTFLIVSQTEDQVVLEITIEPTDGYPYELVLQIGYHLTDTGLTGHFSVTNNSSSRAPFGIAFHPYFRYSRFETSELTVTSSAKKYYEQDAYQIPTVLSAVDGTVKDLRSGKVVAGAGLDDYYTDLEFTDGKAATLLLGPDGSGIRIWQEGIYKHLVVYTTDNYPQGDDLISGIAIEPSTSEADALNRQEDLIWLEQAKPVSGSWGIELVQ